MLEVCETTIGRLRIDPTRLRTDGWRNDSLAKRPTFYSFDQAAPPCQKALDESGYHYTLQYEPAKTSKRKNRQRNNILWYNPPFSKNTSTNIGHKFLALVDKHFPKDHKLRKIFNRNTIKISYSCMNNTKQIIDNHNKRILTSSIQIDNTTTATAASASIAIISNLPSHRHT